MCITCADWRNESSHFRSLWRCRSRWIQWLTPPREEWLELSVFMAKPGVKRGFKTIENINMILHLRTGFLWKITWSVTSIRQLFSKSCCVFGISSKHAMIWILRFFIEFGSKWREWKRAFDSKQGYERHEKWWKIRPPRVLTAGAVFVQVWVQVRLEVDEVSVVLPVALEIIASPGRHRKNGVRLVTVVERLAIAIKSGEKLLHKSDERTF